MPNSTKFFIEKTILLRDTLSHATLPVADIDAQATLVATALNDLQALTQPCADIESCRSFLNDDSLNNLIDLKLPVDDTASVAQTVGVQTRSLDQLLQQHVDLCDQLGEQFFNLDAQLAQVERARLHRAAAAAATQE